MSEGAGFVLPVAATIRRCREADLPHLEWFGTFSHHREIIRDTFELQRRGEVVMLVADAGGFPIGQAWLHLARGPVPRVWAVRVLSPFQGTGLGARLMAALDETGLELGFGSLELVVEQDNLRARAFYERLGWRVTGECCEAYSYTTPEGETVTHHLREWVMTKVLDQASKASPTRA